MLSFIAHRLNADAVLLAAAHRHFQAALGSPRALVAGVYARA